jgi:hypothetical protein
LGFVCFNYTNHSFFIFFFLGPFTTV